MPPEFGVDTEQLGPGSELFRTAAKMLSNNMTAAEQKELPADFAAQAKIRKESAEGLDSRTQLYNALMNKNSLIDQKQAALLDQMNTNKPLSKSQVASMMLIGLIPILAGGAINGRRGIAQGANAAATGVSVAAKGFENQNERAQNAAATEYKSLQSQKEANSSQANNLIRDDFKAADTATQKELDRGTKLQAAAIRASGDAAGQKAVAGELKNIGKALDNDKKAAEAAARIQPVSFGGKVYRSKGSVTDDRRKKVDEVMPDFKNADRDITALYRLSSDLDLPALERMWADENSELSQRRQSLINTLHRLNEVPGRGGKYMTDMMEKMVANPRSFYQNFVAQLPGKTGIPEALATSKKLLRERADTFLQSNGADQVIDIGQAKQIDGKIYYFKGYDEDGNAIVTDSKNEIEQMLLE